jgi:hypothetical protein
MVPRPGRRSTTRLASSSCIASRSEARETLSTRASSRSGGSLVPGARVPLLISVSMWATISLLTLID